jgi:hypothetical protein
MPMLLKVPQQLRAQQWPQQALQQRLLQQWMLDLLPPMLS